MVNLRTLVLCTLLSMLPYWVNGLKLTSYLCIDKCFQFSCIICIHSHLRSYRCVVAITASCKWSRYSFQTTGSHSKKDMECKKFGNCLTNVTQKSQHVFGQNFYRPCLAVERPHCLPTVFLSGSIYHLVSTTDKTILCSF